MRACSPRGSSGLCIMTSTTHDVLFGKEMGRFSTILNQLALIFSTKENHGCLRTGNLQKFPSMPTKRTLRARASDLPFFSSRQTLWAKFAHILRQTLRAAS